LAETAASQRLFCAASDQSEHEQPIHGNRGWRRQCRKSDGVAVRTFIYDAENPLVASTQPNTASISYSYDGDGRRVVKNVGGAITTSPVYALKNAGVAYTWGKQVGGGT
jgi:YD repeat-containing protein